MLLRLTATSCFFIECRDGFLDPEAEHLVHPNDTAGFLKQVWQTIWLHGNLTPFVNGLKQLSQVAIANEKSPVVAFLDRRCSCLEEQCYLRAANVKKELP